MRYIFCCVWTGLLLLASEALAKPVDIIFWHSLAGNLGNEVRNLAQDFNERQSDYQIKPVYKGDYLTTLTGFAAAFRAQQPPDMVQVFEVGKATMLASKGLIKPVSDLMLEQNTRLPVDDFFPVVRDYYSERGQLMAMPFNISLPVLFYNADVLRAFGYTEQNFPTTWQAFENLAKQLKNSGVSCVYTSANPAWILLESFASVHNISMMDETNSKMGYNHPTIVQHLERLRRWQKKHYFEYGGRTDDATAWFTSGRCLLYSQSSGAYNSLQDMVSFNLGMVSMPIDADVSKTRHANLVGGGALWVVSGRSEAVYQGIARFLEYWAMPKVQKRWVQRTGYLPLGLHGSYSIFEEGSLHPVVLLAKSELNLDRKNKPAMTQNQIRMINSESLEAMFAGLKSPQKAMDSAVIRASHALERFRRNTHD